MRRVAGDGKLLRKRKEKKFDGSSKTVLEFEALLIAAGLERKESDF